MKHSENGDLYANVDYEIEGILCAIPLDTSAGDCCHSVVLSHAHVMTKHHFEQGDTCCKSQGSVLLKSSLRIELPITKKTHIREGKTSNKLQLHSKTIPCLKSPVKTLPPDRPERLFFDNLLHQQEQQHEKEPIEMLFSELDIIHGFDFLKPTSRTSKRKTFTPQGGGGGGGGRASEAAIHVSSLYKVFFHVLEWPLDVCESFSDKTVCPTELKFSAVILAKNLETGECFRVIPKTQLDVRALLIGSTNDVDYEDHISNVNTVWGGNQSATPLEISTSEYNIQGLRILGNHPVFESQNTLVQVQKKIEKKYPDNVHMNTKLKFVRDEDYRISHISPETGIVRFSKLNIAVPDKLPASSSKYPNLRRKVFWDYCYHLLFRVDIPLEWLEDTCICIGAVTERIITVHSRNTAKNRRKIEYSGLLGSG